MSEKENSKKRDSQFEFPLSDKNKKLSLNSRNGELTKKSTQASNNLNYDNINNVTQTSVQNIYGENKFKIQYENLKKEEIQETGLKRSVKIKIKIDHKEISKLRKSKTLEIKTNTNFRSDLIEIKNNNKNLVLTDKDFEIKNKNSTERDNKDFDNVKIRKDAFGEDITKENKKKFKVSFLDFLKNKDDLKNLNNIFIHKTNQIKSLNAFTYDLGISDFARSEKQFVEVIKVESYKRLYLRLEEIEFKEKSNCKPCGCSIF